MVGVSRSELRANAVLALKNSALLNRNFETGCKKAIFG
jgi:hypothetical protein